MSIVAVGLAVLSDGPRAGRNPTGRTFALILASAIALSACGRGSSDDGGSSAADSSATSSTQRQTVETTAHVSSTEAPGTTMSQAAVVTECLDAAYVSDAYGVAFQRQPLEEPLEESELLECFYTSSDYATVSFLVHIATYSDADEVWRSTFRQLDDCQRDVCDPPDDAQDLEHDKASEDGHLAVLTDINFVGDGSVSGFDWEGQHSTMVRNGDIICIGSLYGYMADPGGFNTNENLAVDLSREFCSVS